MDLDNKQKVLIAIYTEYQKDLPDMENAITANNLGIGRDVLKVALNKLTNEGLITGVIFSEGGASSVPLAAAVDYCQMTGRGIEYIENKLDIKPGLTGSEKVADIIEKSASWGWEQIKDIAAKVLAEMAKTG